MDVSTLHKLNALSTDNLTAMKAYIEEILKSRLDTSPAPGRVAFFNDGTIDREVRIDKVNGKTVNATEISPISGHKWRIGRNLIRVVPVERRTPRAMTPPVMPHRPRTESGAW